MRKAFSIGLVVATATFGMLPLSLGAAGRQVVATQQHRGGTLTGIALGADKQPLPNRTVRARDTADGRIAGTTTTSATGAFTFPSLSPGHYVVEIVDDSGKIIGLSPAIDVTAGSAANVTVTASAAGALKSGGGFSLFGLGPLASVGVIGAASAVAVTGVVAMREGKIVLCHKENGAAQTIKVAESAKDAHLGHGDVLGACEASGSR